MSSMMKHQFLQLLLNPKCSMSGQALPCPTLGSTVAFLVDSVHSQWDRMEQDLALCL